MTLPASGPLSLGGSASNSINNEFGYGANLGDYRNKLYTNDAGTTTSAFPFAPNSISIPSGTGYSFYNSRKIPSGSIMYTPGSGTFTIPPYNTITFSVLAGGGGGGGGGGGTANTNYCQGDNGGSGGDGTKSSLTASGWSGYVANAGGGGGGGCGAVKCSSAGSTGSPNYNGKNGGSYGGGGTGGGSHGGSGGAGQLITATLSNPLLGGSGLAVGTVINYSVGGGGSTGGQGVGRNINYLFQCYNDGSYYGGGGDKGGDGSITISWN